MIARRDRLCCRAHGAATAVAAVLMLLLANLATPVASAQQSAATTSPGSVPAVSLGADASGFCAVVSTGRAKCWGEATHDALGAPTPEVTSAVPVTVTNLYGAKSIISDVAYTYCALLISGGVKC